MTRLVSGDKLQHFKRELLTQQELREEPNKYLYEFVGLATHSETMEKMVVYRALYGGGELFVRPAEMFFSRVDHEKYPSVKQKYRFEKTQ